MTILTANQLEQGLSGFYGTEDYHFFNSLCRKVVLTDGTKFLADNAGAYWLMDIIGSVYTAHPNRKQFWEDGFAIWTLKVEGTHGIVTADDGRGHIFYTQEIQRVDFLLPEIELNVALGETVNDGLLMVIMLPSEN